MSHLVTLDPRELTVGKLDRLRIRHIDRYENPLDTAIRLDDLDAFKAALKQTCDETTSYHYNFRRSAQWESFRLSKPSFPTMLCHSGRIRDPRPRDDETPVPEYTPDMEEFKLIVLVWAMETSRHRIIDMLLRCDIDVHKLYPLSLQGTQKTEYGHCGTILHTAARYSTPAICAALLERGANLYQESSWDGTPLEYAILGKNLEVVEMLCPSVDLLERRNNEGDTPLLELCQRGFRDGNLVVKIAERLVALGADVRARDNKERSTLHGAAIQANVVLVKWLVEAGVSPDEADEDGLTPLQCFALADPHKFRPHYELHVRDVYGYIRSVSCDRDINRVFISHSGTSHRAETRNKSHQTLLSAATDAENWILCELLIQGGGEYPAAKRHDMSWLKSALGMAAHQGCASVFAHALSLIPDTEPINFVVDELFILRYMRDGLVDHLPVLKAMSEADWHAEPSALKGAIVFDLPTPLVRGIFQLCSDHEMQDWNYGSHDILLTAALKGQTESFRFLLHHVDATFDVQEDSWWSLIDPNVHLQLGKTFASCVAEALQQASSLELLDHDSMTPLLRAALWRNAAMVRALLQCGAKIDA